MPNNSIFIFLTTALNALTACFGLSFSSLCRSEDGKKLCYPGKVLSPEMPIARVFGFLKLLAVVVLTATSAAAEQGWNAVLGSILGQASTPVAIDMGACEKATHVEFFFNSGCPGFLTDILEEDIVSLSRARLPFVLYVDGLISSLTSDTNYFLLGPHVMHAIPPRLPHKLAMLKLRNPEIIALKARDGIIAAETVLGPIMNQTGGDVVGEVKKRIQVLGAQPLPSQILNTLGHHDSRLLAIWAQEDPDGLRTFLVRIEHIIDRL